jgi:dihydroorotase
VSSLDILKHHRTNGLKVTAGVTAAHLMLNENDVIPYRTFCKMFPPLRSEEDRMALVDAVCEGEINVVVSSHIPGSTEQKRQPFGDATFGAAGLETLLSIMLNLWHKGQCSLAQALRPVTCNPADILGLKDLGRLQKGCQADLTLVDVHASRQILRENLLAQSTNTPFEGYQFEGIVQKTWVKGKEVYSV